jgi:hypothetical protein
VISDVQTNIENVFGAQAVAFQGVSEWALDYLVTSEAVWMPTEEQLRRLLEENLLAEAGSGYQVSWTISVSKGARSAICWLLDCCGFTRASDFAALTDFLDRCGNFMYLSEEKVK